MVDLIKVSADLRFFIVVIQITIMHGFCLSFLYPEGVSRKLCDLYWLRN